MEKMNPGPTSNETPSQCPKRTPSPCVVGSVLCEYCHSGYVPTPEQAIVLVAIPGFAEWTSSATGYALKAGWYRRADGLLLCTKDAEIGDTPLPSRMTWR